MRYPKLLTKILWKKSFRKRPEIQIQRKSESEIKDLLEDLRKKVRVLDFRWFILDTARAEDKFLKALPPENIILISSGTHFYDRQKGIFLDFFPGELTDEGKV